MRIDGSERKEFAPPAIAAAAAQRLCWCSRNETLTVKSLLLREPMVYYSVCALSDDEPSCIDLSLEVRQPSRLSEPAPSAYPTYAQLSPAQRACTSNGFRKTEPLQSNTAAYAFLFLSGLERRLLLERSDLNEIVKEILRLLATYASFRVLELHLNRLLSFSLARLGFENFDSHVLKAAFERAPANCKHDDLAVVLFGSATKPSFAGVMGHGDGSARFTYRQQCRLHSSKRPSCTAFRAAIPRTVWHRTEAGCFASHARNSLSASERVSSISRAIRSGPGVAHQNNKLAGSRKLGRPVG